MAMAKTSDFRSAWINSKDVSTRLRLSPASRSTLSKLNPAKLLGQDKKSYCHLKLIGRGSGQGIIAYCEDTNQLILFTNHHLIHSKSCVTEWTISVGDIKGRQLCEKDFTACVSCCGPDGIFSEIEHPEQKSLCQFNADFTVLVIDRIFATDLVSSNLWFPVISSSNMKLLNTVNNEQHLYLMEKVHDNLDPTEYKLVNMQLANLMISDSLSLSRLVNAYKQLCQLKYQAEGVGAGNSGGGVFIKEGSVLRLVGLHKSTQTDEEEKRTNLHSGIAIHFIHNILFCKCGITQSGEPQQPIIVHKEDAKRVQEQLEQKISTYKGQLVVSLSLLMDMKKKGRQFSTQINVFYESVTQHIKHFSGIIRESYSAGIVANDLKSKIGDLILATLDFLITERFLILVPGIGKEALLPLFMLISSAFEHLGECHSVGELGLMITKLYSSERSRRQFCQKIHDVGCHVYDVVKESDEVPIIELCFTVWQYLHCVLFQDHADVKLSPIDEYEAKVATFKSIADNHASNSKIKEAFKRIRKAYDDCPTTEITCDLQDFKPYQLQIDSNSIQCVNLEDLDECDRIDLSAKISELTRKIKAKFCKLRNWLINAIKADKVDRDILISTMSDVVEFTEEESNTLTNSGVIMKMVSHSSYLNYNLLEDIIYALELDRRPFEEYLSDFSKFCAVTPCVEISSGSTESSTPRSIKVNFKLKEVDFKRLSVKDIDSVRERIAKSLVVRKSALYIDSVEEGCVSLTFSVPRFIVDRVFPLSGEQVETMYAQLNVLSIAIQYPSGVQIVKVETEAKHLQETSSWQQKYKGPEEVPRKEKVMISQETQPEKDSEIKKEGSLSEPGSLQQPVQFSHQPILSLDTHGKKEPEISEPIKETQKFKITKLAHTRRAETLKVEPEKFNWIISMIHLQLCKANEELLKASKGADIGEEAREIKRKEIYQKMKLILESIDQDLQEIVTQIPELEITDRVLQLTEETLQLLEKGDGRPREGLQEDIQKVKWGLTENIREGGWVNPYWRRQLDVDQLLSTRQTLEELFLCLPKRTGLEELFVKVKDKLTLLECDPRPFMTQQAHYLLHRVSSALEHYQRIMRIEEHFQKMSIQKKDEEVQSEVQSTEKEKTFGHTEHSYLEPSWLEEVKKRLDSLQSEIYFQTRHTLYPSRIKKVAESRQWMRFEAMKKEQISQHQPIAALEETPPQVEKFKRTQKHTTVTSQPEDTISSEGGTKIKSITEVNLLQWEDIDKMRQEQERKQQMKARFEATESSPELGSLQQVSHEPVKVQAAEEKHHIKPAQVQETTSQQLKYEDIEEVPKEEEVKTSQETQPDEGTEIEKEGSPSEPGLLQQPIQMISQPIMSLDTHGKKKHEISEDVQERKITQKRKGEIKKLEPKEIEQMLEMIHQELHEKLSKVSWEAADIGEEAREIKRKEIYQKLKLTLQNIDQYLQEIVAQIPELEITERALQLTEETLQLLQKGEGRARLREHLCTLQELDEIITMVEWQSLDQQRWIDVRVLTWPIRRTLGDLLRQLPKQTGLEELFIKVEDTLNLLGSNPVLRIIPRAHDLLHRVSSALEDYQRIMRIEEHFQKMSIQRKEEEVQSEVQSTEKEKTFGHTEYSYFELSRLEYQQEVKEIQEEIQKELDHFWLKILMHTRHPVYLSRSREMAMSRLRMKLEEMKGEQTPPQVEKFKKHTTVMSQPEDTISSEGGTKSLKTELT